MLEQSTVIIFTTSFGMGHVSVAHAIKEQLLDADRELNIEIVDIMDISNPRTKIFYFNLYKFLTRKVTRVYNYFYKVKKEVQNNYIDRMMYTRHAKKIATYIREKEPKFIVSTFPLCSGFVSRAKGKYGLEVPLITAITDVVDSWEWVHPHTDMYFVPSKTVGKKLENKGVEEKKIRVTGVPVQKAFLSKHQEDSQGRQVLIMGSAMDKLGLNNQLLDQLEALPNIKTVIVTGSNQQLYNQLEKNQGYQQVTILGHTKKIAEYMATADLLVTKPGGVTVFEAISKGLPMLIKHSHVGQEEENIKFLQEKGMGVLIEESITLDTMIFKILTNEKQLEKMKMTIQAFRKEIDPDKVGQYALELLQ